MCSFFPVSPQVIECALERRYKFHVTDLLDVISHSLEMVDQISYMHVYTFGCLHMEK